MERAEAVAFELHKVSLRQLGVLAVHFADGLLAPEDLWCNGSSRVGENQLERVLDLVIRRLGINQLVAVPHSTDIAI